VATDDNFLDEQGEDEIEAGFDELVALVESLQQNQHEDTQ
jgi:hypothetical protein